MNRLKIDGHDLRSLSVDQIGATLQQLASELSIRGNAVNDKRVSENLLWAFERVEESARALRKIAPLTVTTEVL